MVSTLRKTLKYLIILHHIIFLTLVQMMGYMFLLPQNKTIKRRSTSKIDNQSNAIDLIYNEGKTNQHTTTTQM